MTSPTMNGAKVQSKAKDCVHEADKFIKLMICPMGISDTSFDMSPLRYVILLL